MSANSSRLSPFLSSEKLQSNISKYYSCWCSFSPGSNNLFFLTPSELFFQFSLFTSQPLTSFLIFPFSSFSNCISKFSHSVPDFFITFYIVAKAVSTPEILKSFYLVRVVTSRGLSIFQSPPSTTFLQSGVIFNTAYDQRRCCYFLTYSMQQSPSWS